MEWSYIKKKVVEEEETLPVDFNLIPLPINRIIKDGLGHDTINRMTFEEVKFNLDNHRYVSFVPWPEVSGLSKNNSLF